MIKLVMSSGAIAEGRTLIRAQYIFLNEQNMLLAIFDNSTEKATIEKLAAQISFPGAEKGVSITNNDAIALWVGFTTQPGLEGFTAVTTKLKELTSPELPYTLQELVFKLSICPCGEHYELESEFKFMAGMDAQVTESLVHKLYQRVKQFSLTELQSSPQKRQGCEEIISDTLRDMGICLVRLELEWYEKLCYPMAHLN